MSVDEKMCRRCKQIKPSSAFSRYSYNVDGLFSYCKDCMRAYSRENHVKNRERANTRGRLWHQQHRQQVADYHRIYEQEHPEVRAVVNANRRAELAESKGTVSSAEFADLCSKTGFICLCCGMRTHTLELDHVVPLSKGGSNTIDNVQPLCRSCNAKKHTKTVDYRKENPCL